ncbi:MULTISPECIES: GNAT family N-acetyltransferase [Arthrobacter]|uniref:GNAT family N-acetyltransferase n=2 Tax=Arthrobacter TaxID=1663 RepID=A0ABU9KH23_9MICC|nr:GNAT family N-acetyltransferase [Arthrobacter sp. YJM1]MDP5226118.1 GNAT family N-acetyltransferase [Arthrobacter sp. YJM1]
MSRIREASRADVPEIHQMIVDLAVYEKEPDAVRNTPAELERHLFDGSPAIYAAIAEDDLGRTRGFALWFLNYSTWEGVHGVYLEDLYVKPEARGEGHGKALLTYLAGLAVERGYARMEWSVLNWNQPSIDFYESLGAFPMSEWSTFRLTGDALRSAGEVFATTAHAAGVVTA